MANQPDAWVALGDPTRKEIFELLVDRPYAVVDLARQLPVSRPRVSQQLRVLQDAGLVASEASGTRRIYRINPDGLAGLRADLDRFWETTLSALEGAATTKREEDE